MVFQKTLQAPIVMQGIGVHAGIASTIELRPAPENTGIVFINIHNLKQRIRIGSVVPDAAMHATVIKTDGWHVSTIEHLMAALWAFGITNLEILVTGTEVPILDGSALLFCHEIRRVGVAQQQQHAITISPKEDVVLADDRGRSLVIKPAREGLSITYIADFKSPLVGERTFALGLTTECFEQVVAPARTFGFLDQLPLLRQYNLARGTSLGNTLVIGDDMINPMRLPGECIRHKMLDLIGDMGLLGVSLVANVVATKTGHDFNRLLVKHYKEHPALWTVII